MGKMVKTTHAYCRKCQHGSVGSTGTIVNIVCMYLIDTGKDRGCEIGECDKFEAKTIKRTKMRGEC